MCTEHQSGRCVLYGVGDHCHSWLLVFSLSSSKHSAGSESKSSPQGSCPQQEETGKLLSEIMDVAGQSLEA